MRKKLKKGEAIRNDKNSDVGAELIIKEQAKLIKIYIDGLDSLI
jgi:hypothetical protein